MVNLSFHPLFQSTFSKIKDSSLKGRLLKKIAKLKESPELGKPMRYGRKGTRELYISPFRLSYIYLKEKDKIVLMDLYHKDEQ